VFAAENRRFSEVTWFYPVGDNNTEITNYVTYNYESMVWSIGTLGRGAWIAGGTREYPIASSVIDGGNNYLFEHEVGFDDDGQAMTAYIESGGIELAEGESFAFMKRIIPDFEFKGNTEAASVDVVIKGANFPLQEKSTLSTSTVTSDSTQLYVRNRAREISVRLESNEAGYGWRSGDLRLDLRTDGKR
jgi:hypothetical protein